MNDIKDTAEKQDRRIRKTKRAIHAAFLELLEEKNFDDITILELTERADVNRKTFYNHYSNIADVVEEIEDEWAERLIKVLSDALDPFRFNEDLDIDKIHEHAADLAQPFFETTINELHANPVYFKLLENTAGYSNLINKIVKKEKDLLVNILRLNITGENMVWMEYFLLFVTNGTMAIIDEWHKKDYPVTSDDMARFCKILFASEGVYEFIKAMSGAEQ